MKSILQGAAAGCFFFGGILCFGLLLEALIKLMGVKYGLYMLTTVLIVSGFILTAISKHVNDYKCHGRGDCPGP